MAVSVGNVHLQESATGSIDLDLLHRIEAVTDVPLVLHGASGIPAEIRRKLAWQTSVCKFNVGTELRQVFGAALRAELASRPEVYDRISLLSATEPAMTAAARTVMRGLSAPDTEPRRPQPGKPL